MIDNAAAAAAAAAVPPGDNSTAAAATVRRYAPPNQRSRPLSRRKSSSSSSSYGGGGGGKLVVEPNLPNSSAAQSAASEDEAVLGTASSTSTTTHLLNDLPPLTPTGLITMLGCCRSGAAQLLTDRWLAAVHSYNDPSIDLSERPVMYSGAGASAWGNSRLSHQMDFLTSLRRAISSANVDA